MSNATTKTTETITKTGLVLGAVKAIGKLAVDLCMLLFLFA